jgi:hypothetical protein
MVQVSDAAAKWGSSGLAWLTGLPDRPADFSRADVLTHADRVAAALARRIGVAVDAAVLLSGRAGLLGLTRRGRISAGGATRLVRTRDGWCAFTLSRADDVAAVPALVHSDEAPADPWPMLQHWAATRPVSEVIERAALLDIPAAGLAEAGAAPPHIGRLGARTAARELTGLLVADLSSMWAGPLCGQLLARGGATVVKVESPRRPDGTRAGNSAFFDWINGEKLSYCLDFDDNTDELRELLSTCDVVIEGSRPAALARRRLGPDQLSPKPGRIWLRISGYEDSGRPAFGDDAAVAGGLAGTAADGPVFCGDAIADPLTGLDAAKAVADALARGGGELIHLSMAAVAANYAALPAAASACEYPVSPPPIPPCGPSASELGADNDAVRRLIFERRCPPC